MLPPNAKPLRHLLRGDAPGRHYLAPAARARHQGEVRPGYTERPREEQDQGIVGGTFHRWRGEPDPQFGPVKARNLVAGGARLHPDGDAGAGGAGSEWRQYGSTWKAAHRSTIRIRYATSGLRSSIPKGGMCRWIGMTSQSVSRYTGRSQRA